jgi:hypothetical protein
MAEHTFAQRVFLMAPRAAGLPQLDAAAVWMIAALRNLLQRGGSDRPEAAWKWVDLLGDLRRQTTTIQNASDQPACCCPLVPVQMLVEVPGWPAPGDAIPVEYAEREVRAEDNRRLVGKVAKTLINHVALHCMAAQRARENWNRDGLASSLDHANECALRVRDLGRRALRGVDLDALARAVDVEVARRRPGPAERDSKIEVEFVDDNLAVVKENGRSVARVPGKRQAWLLRMVFEAHGRDVLWEDLVQLTMGMAAEELELRRSRAVHGHRCVTTPRMALRPDSLQRTGNRVKEALGKFDYLWHQDRRGARWADPGS